MTDVTIFGTGNMGTAIGDLLTGDGASVRRVTRSDDATITGDIVVLARRNFSESRQYEELP